MELEGGWHVDLEGAGGWVFRSPNFPKVLNKAPAEEKSGRGPGGSTRRISGTGTDMTISPLANGRAKPNGGVKLGNIGRGS